MNSVKLEKWQKICLVLCGAGFVCSLLLFMPFVQNLILDFGESLVHRPLTRQVWIGRFIKWGVKLCTLFAILGIVILFIKHKWKIPSFEKNKNSWIIIVCLTILCFIVGFINLNSGHNWGGDFSEYIADVRNLATKTYNPNQPKLGYLYGTALILLPFYSLFGLNLFALKIPMAILYAGSVFFIGMFFKKRLHGHKLLLSIAIFAFNPYMIDFLNNVLSDIPFLFFSSVAVYCIDGLYAKENSLKKQILLSLIAGASITFSKMCREEGLVLLIAFACTEILLIAKNILKEKTFINIISQSLNSKGIFPHITLYFSIFISLFILHFFIEITPNRSDMVFLSNISIRTIINMARYNYQIIKDFLFGSIALWFLCLPLLVIGFVKKFSSEIFITIYTIGIFSLHTIWSGTQGLRFLFSILPFVVLFIFYGFEYLNDVFKEKYYNVIRKGYIIFAILICLFFAEKSISSGISNIHNRREWNYGAFSSYAMETYSYIRENTNEDDKILSYKPRVIFLNTFRGTYNPVGQDRGPSLDKEILNNQLKGNDYFLLIKDFSDSINDFEIPKDKQLNLVFENGKFELYKIIK